MVKKKSFWLILLTVLTAVVLAFCACGLVGCSSESDDDDTKTEGNEGDGNEGGGSGSGDSGSSGGSGSGDSGSSGGSGSGDSGSSGGSSGGTEGGGSTVDDGSFVLQGYYDALGTDYWGVITFNADGSGYFGTYYQDTGEPFSMFCGDIEWEYTDEDNMKIDATMSIMGQPAVFPVVLAAVNGQVVAGTVTIEEVGTDAILYVDTAVGALVSKDLMGGTHANVVLYNDYECVVEIEGEAETGTWEYTDDGAGVSLTVGQTPYTATIEVNDKGQITEAVFADFEGVTSAVFLPIGTVDYTLYSFVSNEGYTLIMNDDGTFETTVDGTTYTGVGSTSTLALADDDNDTTYTPTITYGTDDEGNQYIESVSYETYFGGKTNVTFILPADVVNREDSSDYQEYYNDETKGQAIAVFTGIRVYNADSDQEPGTLYDDVEYWIFLYRDGTFVAHIFDGYLRGSTNGSWTWSVDPEDSNQELVPTFIRNPGQDSQQINYAAKNDDGTYSFNLESAFTSSTHSYYIYTFDIDDMPAGAFTGTISTEGDDTVYYLVLSMDGTFVAHLGGTLNTSTGYWAKDENGTMRFGKNSFSYDTFQNEYTECTQQANADGTITVTINNASRTDFYYTVDPSIIPIGGYDFSEFDAT